MFKKVLVANRGEIARRIIRSLNKMGIESIAVYSTADKDFSYIKEASKAICIGKEKSSESYTCENAILEAAMQSDAQAIHPGFGFLSENALFAKRCLMQKINFIGPQPHLISMMGDKNQAKITMKNMGVKVLEGSQIVNTPHEALHIAQNLGYPVLLKAKAGGGGKGMRLVEKESELKDAFIKAQAESAASFKDGDLYIEKFLPNARHIEFQILGDNYKKVICLGSRECSIQRNNQKLIEEALANVDKSILQKTTDSIINALQNLGYSNAGTMEFLLSQSGELYFMEMNTRIQVEHPVTELVYGLDIVEWQIKIAANQKINLDESKLNPHGHAIECRINAEDVKANFTPKTGKITKLIWPCDSRVRIDTHVEEGSYISPFYDSMIAKVIVHHDTRVQAVKLMQKTLNNIHIEGISTTLDFNKQILNHCDFINGTYNCSFIKDNILSLQGAMNA